MKILIIGAVGTGKTTLAKKMSKEYGIKYYEIDSIVHDDLHNRKRSTEEQKDIIKQINTNENWIIEGTLRKNYNLLDMADKIIYLDIPKWKRNIRIFTRYIKQKLRLEHSNYKPNMYLLKKMYEWSNDYEKNKKEFEYLLEEYKGKTTIISKI